MSNTPRRPVSPKVGSAALGGGVVAQFVLWLLNAFAFGGDMYDNAYSAVPYAVSALVTGGIVFAAGYLPADEASALFAVHNTAQPAALGSGAMGTGPTVAAIEPLTGDTDDGTADEPDADDEPARDPETGRFVAED